MHSHRLHVKQPCHLYCSKAHEIAIIKKEMVLSIMNIVGTNEISNMEGLFRSFAVFINMNHLLDIGQHLKTPNY